MRTIIKRLLQRVGYDLVRYDPSAFFPKLESYLRDSRVNLFLDVGANAGSTGIFLRRIGYRGKIISYEPGAQAHAKLQATANGDPLWEVAPRMAIGGCDGDVELFISENLLSSSTLPMLDAHVDAHANSRYTGTERVLMQTLDTQLDARVGDDSRVFLKIDVQGAEDAVLRGAKTTLQRALGVQLELSLAPLYAGQALLPEMLECMARLGFQPYAMHHGFEDDRSGRLLQLDCVFVRSESGSGRLDIPS